MSMLNKIVSMIKLAVSTSVMTDTKQFPFLQAQFMTKLNDIWIVTPYGLYSSPPNGSMGLVFNIQAQEQNRAGIFNDYDRRPKNLKEGEVAVFNTLTKTRITLKANGDLDIFVNKDRTVTIDGNETVTVNGGLVTYNVDLFRINGDLDVTGKIRPKNSSATDIRDIFDAHVHPENDNGGPTDAPTTGQ